MFMKFKIVLLLLVSVIFFSIQSYGQNMATKELNDLHSFVNKRKFFSLNFVQNNYSPRLKKNTISSGIIEFKSPKNFRFEKLLPNKLLYVSNGKNFWLYDEANKFARKLGNEMNEVKFLDILLNPGSISNDFTIEEWTINNYKIEKTSVDFFTFPSKQTDKILIKLIPKSPNSTTVFYLIINKKINIIEDLRLFHSNGSITQYIFNNFVEKDIDLNKFNFEVPNGIQVK